MLTLILLVQITSIVTNIVVIKNNRKLLKAINQFDSHLDKQEGKNYNLIEHYSLGK